MVILRWCFLVPATNNKKNTFKIHSLSGILLIVVFDMGLCIFSLVSECLVMFIVCIHYLKKKEKKTIVKITQSMLERAKHENYFKSGQRYIMA